MTQKVEQKSQKAKVKRARSASFPFLSLSDSIVAIKEIVKYGDEVTPSSLAPVLGHSTSKSGPFLQKVSSLRNWSLLEGRGEMLRVSELSKRIVYPKSGEQEIAAIREAFKKCRIFGEVFSKLEHGSKLKLSIIGNLAVREYGVSDSAKDAFVSSFVKSAVVAKLVQDVTDESIILREEDHVFTDADDGHNSDGDTFKTPGEVNAGRRTQPPGAAPPIVTQRWPLSHGTITFEICSTIPLDAMAYSKISSVVTSIQNLAVDLGWTSEVEGDESEE